MKTRTIVLFLLILQCNLVVAQKVDKDSLSIEIKQIKIVKSPWGLQFGFGISKFIYQAGTENWIGNHTSPDIKFILYHNNLSFGLNFKPWTVNPKNNLFVGGDTLSSFADLNPIKLELNIGYNYNVTNTTSIESYIGYLNSSFHVINQDVLQKKYNISSQHGITLGANINKYIEFLPYQYIVFYLNTNYNFSDYTKIHPSLGSSFYAIELGVAFKGWFKKTSFN